MIHILQPACESSRNNLGWHVQQLGAGAYLPHAYPDLN
jgi:hypothetical protein